MALKRPRESLGEDADLGAELSANQASVVEAAVERWERALVRKAELRLVLQREQELIREIMGCGFRGGDLKTLRRLVTGGDRSEGDALRQDVVVASMVAETARLQTVLRENHRALVELIAGVPQEWTTGLDRGSQDREDILRELDAVRASLRSVQSMTHSKLLRAKAGPDLELVRTVGRSLNELRALLRKLEADRHEITRNSRLAALLVAVCRRVLPAREVDPAELRDVQPAREGYLKIMDFYFFSDASKFCFEETYSGPNWFTRLKRNVAILHVLDSENRLAYNQFAVSGVHRKPGAPLAPDTGQLKSTQAEDEHGRVFDRRHDAEFKLLNDFVSHFPDHSFSGRATLWTRKALCRSCAGAVRQFQQLYPSLPVEVVEDTSLSDSDALGPPCKVARISADATSTSEQAGPCDSQATVTPQASESSSSSSASDVAAATSSASDARKSDDENIVSSPPPLAVELAAPLVPTSESPSEQTPTDLVPLPSSI